MLLNDNSLNTFLEELNTRIHDDTIQNSYITFEYKELDHKNKLYNAIEDYKNKGSIFYSELIENNDYIIKRIGDIKMHEIYKTCCENGKMCKCVVPTGKYYLQFTVFYEKCKK